MSFGDLKSPAGLKALNDYLQDKSYIEGYQPSQADTAAFGKLAGLPGNDFINVLRWYNHIKSYGAEKDSFPGQKSSGEVNGSVPAKKEEKEEADDDDFDPFKSDEEDDAEAERIKQERLAAYEAKKSKKAVVIAKSNIVLDVKPWDDETDMAELEKAVRTVEADGLLWGASKLVPLAYGIKKLQITCVVEDDKVGTDFLEEEITKFEDLIQSVDIAAFNKI
jgi:elongation factor 1-beta